MGAFGPEEIIEETEETKLVRNGNGALLRIWKHKSGTPEHVAFEVKDRIGWEDKIRPLVTDKKLYEKRIWGKPGFDYDKMRKRAKDQNKFFVWIGVLAWECSISVCGHEHFLMGMALDPDWVKDMCETYANVTVDLMRLLFKKEGPPDGLYIGEDMGLKGRPFISPKMYKEIVWPAHKKICDYAHNELGIPVIMHSCGYVEPLIPGIIEAGVNCLQGMEFKAGMDALKLKKEFGDRLVLFGGLDVRVLETNDNLQICNYLKDKLLKLKVNGGYMVHSDHSIPNTVNYETYKNFVETCRELGRY